MPSSRSQKSSSPSYYGPPSGDRRHEDGYRDDDRSSSRHRGRSSEDHYKRGDDHHSSRDHSQRRGYRIDEQRDRDGNRRDDERYQERRGHHRDHSSDRPPRDDHRYSSRDRDNEDWRCRECNAWNHPRDHRCIRCGFPVPRSSSRGGPSRDSEDDFGRQRRQPKSSSKKNAPKRKRIWPPCFQEEGSAFVLDTRSGMFYEAESDFFYDPKSQLYYGNKQKSYYRFDPDDPTAKCGFAKVDNKDEEETTTPKSKELTDQEVLFPSLKSSNAATKPATIAIKLKQKIEEPKKKRKKRKQEESIQTTTTTTTTTAIPSEKKVAKIHATNMNIWSERSKEKQQDRRRPLTTKRGEPICWLCQRKFPNAMKLQQHERLSQLHKENLELDKNRCTMVVGDNQHYMDRAQQRRNLYFEGSNTALGDTVASLKVQDDETTVQDKPTTTNLLQDKNNVGHQMLEKLGWKKGSSTLSGATQNDQSVALTKDWDRIESISAAVANQNKR